MAVPRISAFYGIVIWMYHDEIHHRGQRSRAAAFPRPVGEDETSIDARSALCPSRAPRNSSDPAGIMSPGKLL